MNLSMDELAAITVDTWQTLLGLDPVPSAPFPTRDDVIYCATVHITGETQWTVRVDCHGDHALEAASAMFGTEPEETSPMDVNDALGELANVVAGNVKALLDGNARLSLPTVAHGRSFEVTIPGMVETHRASFECDGRPVSVCILEQTGSSKTAAGSAAAAHA